MIKIFISYSNSDKSKSKILEKIIAKSPELKPIAVANDRKASKLLTEKVANGIKDCQYFIPILTLNSIENQWVNQEIGFAEALGKKVIAIVEEKIVGQLKGFIHAQMDLPYQFPSNSQSKHSENSFFSKRAKVLVDDILVENEIEAKEIRLESVFPGKWENEYEVDGNLGHDRDVEIKNENQYFVEGVLRFSLVQFKVDLKQKRIMFVKQGLPGDSRRLENDLKIVKLGKHYEGMENGIVKVKYKRVD